MYIAGYGQMASMPSVSTTVCKFEPLGPIETASSRLRQVVITPFESKMILFLSGFLFVSIKPIECY